MGSNIKILILVLFLVTSFGQIYSSFSDWNQLIQAIDSQKLNYLSENVKYFMKNHQGYNISFECAQAIDRSINAFTKSEDWAFKLFNSWSKFPPSGILTGTMTDFGDYDQCLGIEPNELMGQPQYCLVDISIPVPKPIRYHQSFYHSVNVLPKFLNTSQSNDENKSNVFKKLSENAPFFYWLYIRMGICVPSKCTKDDITALAQTEINNFGLILKNIDCQTKTGFDLDWIQWIALIFLLISLMITISATIYTRIFISNRKYKSFHHKIIQIFSLEINIRKLFSNETNQEISCIHGIRVITLFWVIFGHTIEWTFLGFYRKLFTTKEIVIDPINQPVMQAHYAVETFFFISGLFTTYATLKFTKGEYRRFNTIGFSIYRILRLSPQLIIFILLTFLVPKFGSGPIWNLNFKPIVENCRKNWWHNLLYLQTFTNIDPDEKQVNMCAVHTWFLAIDMQLFWFSIPFLLLLLKNMRNGLIATSLTTLGFAILSSILVFINDYPPSHILSTKSDYMLDETECSKFFKVFFWKPWPHGSVYFVGMLFGIIAAKIKPKKIQRKWLIWSIALIGHLICLYDYLFWAHGEPYTRSLSAVLYPLKRLIWSINLSLVVWMCITGNGGLVNRFLSAKAFIPLSRLTYCVYLTHAWIVWTFWGSKRDLVDISLYSIMSIYLTVLFCSYISGAVFSLLFESPFISIQSYLRKYLLEFEVKDNNHKEVQNIITESDLNQNLVSKV